MTGLRLILTFVLLLVIGTPLALPFLDLWNDASTWQAWQEWVRQGQLAKNTLFLVSGTVALALPAGIVIAVLCYRTDLPGRGLFRFLIVLSLFVPLPLFASAWQAALGTDGWLPLGVWSTPAADDPDVAAVGLTWKPWAQGLPAAIWIHAVAALPWVVVIVGQGLCWVETELEEDGLTAAGPGRVLRYVTLPQCRLSIAAAALWIGLQAATEITITDMFQVRTFAEEVYYQFVLGDDAALGRAVVVSLPLVVMVAALVFWMMARLERQASVIDTRQPRPFALGSWRWRLFVLALGVAGLFIGVPLGGLVWKLGQAGNPQYWRVDESVRAFQYVYATRSRLIGASLLWAAGAGGLTALLALVASWLATESRAFRMFVILLIALAWSLPAPVIGLGLKSTIDEAMAGEEALGRAFGLGQTNVFAAILYEGGSPAPIIWTSVVRFIPFAVALLWPYFRRFPDEWRELARLDGARPFQEFRYLIWPVFLPVTLQTMLAVAILSLGEVSAGKLAETPGTKTFAHELFNQMHYGVSNNLAALALALLALVTVGAAGFATSRRLYAGGLLSRRA